MTNIIYFHTSVSSHSSGLAMDSNMSAPHNSITLVGSFSEITVRIVWMSINNISMIKTQACHNQKQREKTEEIKVCMHY